MSSASAASAAAHRDETRICIGTFEVPVGWVLDKTKQCHLARVVSEHAEGFDQLRQNIEDRVDPSVRHNVKYFHSVAHRHRALYCHQLNCHIATSMSVILYPIRPIVRQQAAPFHFFPWFSPPGDNEPPPHPGHELPEDGNVDDEKTKAMFVFFAKRWRIFFGSNGLMSIEAVKADILSKPENTFGTKDGNNRRKAFLLLLAKLREMIDGPEKTTMIANFLESMVSFQLFLPTMPHVMQALAASTNATTGTIVKTSDLTAFLQRAAFLAGFKESLAAECGGDFSLWVTTKLVPSTQRVQLLGCRQFLRRTPEYVAAQLVRPVAIGNMFSVLFPSINIQFFLLRFHAQKYFDRVQVVFRDVVRTHLDAGTVLMVGEQQVFANFATTPPLTLATLFTLRTLPMSMLLRVSNSSSRAIHQQAHGRKFL